MVISFGGKGYLMGMLALTYIKGYSITNTVTSGGQGVGPNIRITTT